MPTPRPIIETRIGVIVLMSVRPARMNSSRNAVTTAVSASAIGISVATKVRKTMSSTMIAASSPSVSDVPCSTGGNSASPLNSTVTPAGSTVSRTASWTATTVSRSSSSIVSVELRLRVGDAPVVGDRVLAERIADALESRPCPRWARTRPIWSRAIASSIAARRSGVSSCSPSGAAKTTLSTPPCSAANSASIRSVAFCVSDPGISNSSRRLPADRPDEDDQEGDDADPRDDDAPRMRGARTRPARERARRRVVRGPRVGPQ